MDIKNQDIDQHFQQNIFNKLQNQTIFSNKCRKSYSQSNILKPISNKPLNDLERDQQRQQKLLHPVLKKGKTSISSYKQPKGKYQKQNVNFNNSEQQYEQLQECGQEDIYNLQNALKKYQSIENHQTKYKDDLQKIGSQQSIENKSLQASRVSNSSYNYSKKNKKIELFQENTIENDERRKNNNDTYLQVKINEEKKLIRKKMNNETEHRLLLNKCSIGQNITIENICQIQNLEYDDEKFKNIEVFVLDSQTAIPYILLENNIDVIKSQSNIQAYVQESQDKVQDNLQQQNQSPSQKESSIQKQLFQSNGILKIFYLELKKELYIVVNDFFDCFLEYKEIFMDYMQSGLNKSVLLFNLPGQAYTIFNQNEKGFYDAKYHADIIEKLLFKIFEDDNKMSLQETSINFIGFGYGDCPSNSPNLAFNFISFLFNSISISDEQIDQKYKINPISLEGRIQIINSCLNSRDISDRVQKLPLTFIIIHSLKNCFVNINQSEQLGHYDDSDDGLEAKYYTQNIKKLKKKQVHRQLQYIDGGHALLDL
ncbi:hypothetical protein PPERSA_04243 [Pseudocohnilembus persalinus]|uniref:Uncharacterized protein n=1 Tax=Pseudocohnilembus persalinus TaxID=266149 RepID=A0A0V0QNI7_PSEPJ|nr:hypothetical protein PPERSA_04243 [Pseudocohnilembus persalinus]|eukprot:KRX03735.1 hypothetical protein PPERSA_04243 [Pseudocohnilembus persalinus]